VVRIDSAVVGIDGTWPFPPEQLSFSALKEAETCPRRWALLHGDYPSIWDKNGYPQLPTNAGLIGSIVHEALERIVKAFAYAGCVSGQSEDAVSILRSMGGLSNIVRQAMDGQLKELESNPRSNSQIEHFSHSLMESIPEMRKRVQSLISAVIVERTSLIEKSNSTSRARTAILSNGSYSELTVRSSSLGLVGRFDLLTLNGHEVHLTDFKTGTPKREHAEQMEIYALLWARRDDWDPERPKVTRMTVVYDGLQLEIPPPELDQLNAIGAEITERIKVVRSQLIDVPPQARPSADACRFCQVRHMCQPYWNSTIAHTLDAEFFDLEALVEEEIGPRSWKIIAGAEECILRTSPNEVLPLGSKVRLLGITRRHTSDLESTKIFALTSISEMFEMRAD